MRKYFCHFYVKYVISGQIYIYCAIFLHCFTQIVQFVFEFAHIVYISLLLLRKMCNQLLDSHISGHFKAFTLFCRKLANVAIYAFFCVKFLLLKLRSHNLFDTYHVWVKSMLCSIMELPYTYFVVLNQIFCFIQWIYSLPNTNWFSYIRAFHILSSSAGKD